MTTRHIHRTVRVTALSVLLSLAVFSFVVLGSGSAHAMTRQAASTGTTISVSIVTDQRFFVFRPSAITVKSGTAVKIANTTASELEIRTLQNFYDLLPGGVLTLTPTQSGFVRICGGFGSIMTITVD